MNTHRPSAIHRGFTLIELLVAITITTIIVTVLVSVTGIATDVWTRSRNELRAARQAKAMLDTMTNDFQGMVYRRSNANEWLNATQGAPTNSQNAAKLIFFTAATDRYNGDIGNTTSDLGGDISCVGYQLDYKNSIAGGTANYQTFVLTRALIDPNATFTNLMGKPDLSGAFSGAGYNTRLSDLSNLICDNVLQFTTTFQVEVKKTVGTTTNMIIVPITLDPTSTLTSKKCFRMVGTGIAGAGATNPPLWTGNVNVGGYDIASAEITAGRLVGVKVSITVVSDEGMARLRKDTTNTLASDSKFLKKFSYQYSKLIPVSNP
jgi:prepilin-type N-terminal cleavage/methylation domain-containing protein